MPRQADRGLHFININPNSVRSRSELIHEVRSHAGRWRWQQIRQNGEQDGDVNSEEEHHQPNLPENSDEGTMAVIDDEEFPQTVDLVPDSVSGVAWGSRHSDSVDRSQHPAHEVANIMLDHSGTTLWKAHIQNNPIQNIRYTQNSLALNHSPNVSIFDPFQTAVPSPIPMEFTSANNKYAVSVLWPGLMPRSTMTGNHAGVNAWFSHSVSHPALHSSMLFGSFSHRRVRVYTKDRNRFSADDMKQMSLAHQDSISKINEAIQSPSHAVTDNVILSVLCLANNDIPKSRKVNTSPFRPPLRSLQWLDVYGTLSPNPIHQEGLAQLVRLRGGLERIELPGLAAVISFSSILAASRTLSPPYFPFVSLRGESLTLHDMLGIHTFMDPSDPLSSPQIPKELYDVFCASRLYVSLVEAYVDGSPTAESLGTICDRRNLIQWHIMSLLPATTDFHTAGGSGLYECCRLALSIFGVGVIFPLPSEAAPLLDLAQMLQVQLCSKTFKAASLDSVAAQKIHCWCILMGGLAARGSQERDWFVQELRFWVLSNCISTWDELSIILSSVLWYDNACDLAGKEMWMEALNFSDIR